MSFRDPNEPIPAGLITDEFVLRPIVADDAAADFGALMETREHLRLWEQSTWPADDFTVEANRKDLEGLEERHGAHRAYTYTVFSPDGAECLGCVYLFPITAKFLLASSVTPVGDLAWTNVDAVIFFWARQSRMETGMDERLLAALRTWSVDEWKFTHPVYVTNEQFLQQMDVFGRTDLTLKFEFLEPDKPGKYLAFG